MMLESYLQGRWQAGRGEGTALIDPVTGAVLAHAAGGGLDMAAALAFARGTGGPALRALSFIQRAELLKAIAETLGAHREKYARVALENSGNTAQDAAIDIDGGIGTLKYYASLGKKLGDVRALSESGSDQLTRDENFRGVHVWTTVHGAAVHINAFNFPSWGLWEKASVALLAGVPLLAKPATATCWLSQEMVKDVVAAKILPEGALSLLCGGGRDLMEAVRAGDAVSFTGSADTALALRAAPNVLRQGVRFTVEADSLNLTCLGPDAAAGGPEFALLVREVVRELTVKAGQKCTAIRRILVPKALAAPLGEALRAELGKIVVGDPRNPATQMGPLVSKAQQAAAWRGLAALKAEAKVLCGGADDFAPDGIDPAKGCFVPPTLLLSEAPLAATAPHEIEVFGPAATLMPYADESEAIALALRGGGSLAASLFSADADFAARFALAIAPAHGRVLMVDDSVGKTQSGHGIVMPQSVHGGPGRAGGGEELGALRGLRFYMQRTALQGPARLLERAVGQTAVAAL